MTGRVVTGLNRGTTYYYRVRAYDVTGTGQLFGNDREYDRAYDWADDSRDVRQFDYQQPKRGGHRGDD